MKKISLLFIVLVFILVNFETGRSYEIENEEDFSSGKDPGKKLVVGETLRYVVKYSLLHIGELRFKVQEKLKLNGRDAFKCVAYIDSYDDLPFVDLHQIYNSKINAEDFNSEYFRGLVQHEEYTTFTEYKFDYNKKTIDIQKGKVNPHYIWTDTVYSLSGLLHDGLSIFYYARMKTGVKGSENINVFINEEVVDLKLNYYEKKEPVEIDAVKEPVDCHYLDGYAEFEAIFGMTGGFEGWFSADSLGVPIKAKLHVIIGSITCELTGWELNGWMPPAYKE